MNPDLEETLAEMREQERLAHRKHVCRVDAHHRPMAPMVTKLAQLQWGCVDCGSTQPHLRLIRRIA